MKQHYKHFAAVAVFVALSFFILPELLPKIALHYSPGGLRLPDAPFLHVGLLAVILVVAVLLKNFKELDTLRGPKLWEFLLFGALAILNFGWYTGLLFAIVPSLFMHILLAGFAYGLGLLFLLVALFGLDVFRQLWKDMCVAASALIFYTGVTLFVDTTRFHVLSATLTKWILAPFFTVAMSTADFSPHIRVDSFSVFIGPPCSGVFSMILFTALFSFVYWLDNDKMNTKKTVTLYIIGLAGAFLLNLLRLVVLLSIGALWSPELALGLFHDNAGWILFAGYSFVYWWIAYPHLVDKKNRKPKSI